MTCQCCHLESSHDEGGCTAPGCYCLMFVNDEEEG